MKRLVLLSAGVVALVVLWTRSGTSQAPQVAAVPQRIMIEHARIQLADVRQVAGSQTGVLMKLLVREGDRVEPGDVLAVLDHRVPSASLRVAEKVAENDVDVRFSRKAAEVANAEYRQALAANRIEPNTFSEIEMEKLRLESEKSSLGIEVAQHELGVNRLRREEAATLVETYRILAPIAGIVSRVTKGEGEAVQAGEWILELKSTGTVKVEAELPLKYFGLVQRGAHVTVEPDFVPPGVDLKKFPAEGEVFFVDVSADPVTRSVRILAEVDNANGRLIAGLQGTLSIQAKVYGTQTAQRD